jgi:hypothetical protein
MKERANMKKTPTGYSISAAEIIAAATKDERPVAQKSGAPLFDRISVNLKTGEISYPQLPGFELDMERVYSTAQMHAQFCSMEMAVKHAIHGQLAAYQGAMTLGRR